MSNDRRNAPPLSSEAVAGSLVEARFVPQRYEPNYAYPLLVLLHAQRGGKGGPRGRLAARVFPEGDDAVAAAGYQGPRVQVHGERPDAVGVVV